jgi:hypothetical protein
MGHGFHGYVKLRYVAAWPTLSCVVDFQFLAEEVCHDFPLNQSIEQW